MAYWISNFTLEHLPENVQVDQQLTDVLPS
jgi:hypothetical protein